MLKILWKRGENASEEQFLLLSTVFCYLMLDFYVNFKQGSDFLFKIKRLFEISEVEIKRVDCIVILASMNFCLLHWITLLFNLRNYFFTQKITTTKSHMKL